MYRIGILGTCNSHAEIFCRLFNHAVPESSTASEYLLYECRVVALYGHNRAITEEIALRYDVPFVSENPLDMIGAVDAVMVIFRHGKYHAEYALPFIEAGIPTFVDKPFAISNQDAEDMVSVAGRTGTPLTGGSSCKFAPDVSVLKEILNVGRIGAVRAATVCFPATIHNPYGGLHFYGSHLAEICLALFGYDWVSVRSCAAGDTVTAILRYPDCSVIMNFIPNSTEHYAVLFGEKRSIVREIDISLVFKSQLSRFVQMLKSSVLPQPLDQLVAPVRLVNAVVTSFENGREITT
jgi:predicted dehydrogenase